MRLPIYRKTAAVPVALMLLLAAESAAQDTLDTTGVKNGGPAGSSSGTTWETGGPQRQLERRAAQRRPGRNQGKGGRNIMDKEVDPQLQYWGLAEVRPGAHLFYWLYLTRAREHTPAARPLVLWLQGGPGVSASGYGNFEELGIVDVHLNPRNFTWVNDVNVLFVDSPVGTGFSYVDEPELLARSNKQVADDLVAFTTIFLQRYPDFAATPLYIFSEAYGGKMAAKFALELARAAAKGTLRVNIKGLAMGDPWIAPVTAIQTWAPYLFNLGLVDQNGHDRIMAVAQEAQKAVNNEQWATATALWNATEFLTMAETGGINMRNIITRVSSTFRRLIGSLTDNSPTVGSSQKHSLQSSNKREMPQARNLKPIFRHSETVVDEFMNLQIAPRLGLPSERRWTGISDEVYSALAEDFMKPATDALEALLNQTNVEVSVFSSQLDVIANSPSIMQWLQNLKWSGIREWSEAPRAMLPIAGVVEGDRKSFGNLAVYWVRRVGQMIPADNPRVGRELLRRVTKFDLFKVYDMLSDKK